jgi:hypothetical protein
VIEGIGMNLKHVVISIMLAFSVVSQAGQPAGSVHKNKMLSVDPGNLLLGSIPLRFAFGLAPKVSLGISAYGRFYALGNSTTYGFGGGVDTKFNLSGDNFSDSWYVKPGVSCGYLSSGTFKAPNFSVFVTGGHGWVWDSGFALDLGLGLGYSHWFINESSYIKDFGVRGLLPSLDLSVGWVF